MAVLAGVFAAEFAGGATVARLAAGIRFLALQAPKLRFERVDAFHQAAEGLADGVGNQVVIEVDRHAGRADRTRGGAPADDAGGNADHGAPRRHFLDHHRVGADARAGADADRAEDLGPGADDDAVAQRRVALAGIPGGAAERHAVIEGDIVADLGGLADDDAGAVI